LQTLHAHVSPTRKTQLPLADLALGDVLVITNMEPMPGLRQSLEVGAASLHKTFIIVEETLHKLVLVCARTPTQVWPAALQAVKADRAVNYEQGSYGLDNLGRGQKLEVVTIQKHPYFPYRPIQMPSLRVYVSKRGRKIARKFAVSKTAYGAEVHRTT
jgi:hypothetical protein